MPDRRSALLLLSLAFLLVITSYFAHRLRPTIQSAATQPSTRARLVTSMAATSEPAVVPTRLIDVLRTLHPAIAATQPLSISIENRDAARVLLDRPVLVDSLGHLWIEDPHAATLAATLDAIAHGDNLDRDTFVVADLPGCVCWISVNGHPQAIALETVTASRATTTAIQPTDGEWRTALITSHSKRTLNAAFDLNRITALPSGVLLVGRTGASVITVGDSIDEQFHALPSSDDPLAKPQVVFAHRGLLAWTPATLKSPGGGAAWFVDDHTWKPLDPADWPSSIVQLSPFLDGTVRQLRLGDDGVTTVASATLEATSVDAAHVHDLIDQLDDNLQAKRDAASDQLAQLGPAAWPILRGVGDTVSPEVQQRIAQLLAGADHPSIDAFTPVDGKLQIVRRFDDGTVLIYALAGVTVPGVAGADSSTIAPAWLALRPGHAAELLPDVLTADQHPDHCTLQPMGDEWLAASAATGPQRFVGNSFLLMLRASERNYSQWIATDRRGRSLWREPGKATPTLLIDSTIADPTPRLPTWTIKLHAGETGWTKDGWPAIKRGGTWALHEAGWQAMDEATSPLIVSSENATTQPTAGSSVLFRASTRPIGGEIERQSDRVTASITCPSGRIVPLPDAACGSQPPMILSAAGKLFVYNEPGRLVRLSLHADSVSLDSIFSRGIPADTPHRVWLDPAGRICFACDDSITIAFPDGQIPQEIAQLMSADDLKAIEPE